MTKLKVKCQYCGRVNTLHPPKKKLKRAAYLDLCCSFCGKDGQYSIIKELARL